MSAREVASGREAPETIPLRGRLWARVRSRRVGRGQRHTHPIGRAPVVAAGPLDKLCAKRVRPRTPRKLSERRVTRSRCPPTVNLEAFAQKPSWNEGALNLQTVQVLVRIRTAYFF